ncbi:MAG: hypothetical protein HYS12_17570 [Planctomycetes bacterium]|nr:hypothetical protein [Planctomycetota bacterium]
MDDVPVTSSQAWRGVGDSSASRPCLNMGKRRFLSLLALSLLLLLLNCWKPLHGDEEPYLTFATHIAEHPGDPYGFYFKGPVPANHLLAPPVMLYWCALGIRLFGIQPLLWKLWLLPFSLMLVFALHSLFRRFCQGLEMPLVWLSVLSPTMLPTFNLMLDAPALALSLTAVVLFLRASERGSVLLAALAGLIAGVATQTKYTAFLAPVVILLSGQSFRRVRLSLLAAGIALVLFLGWEFVTAQLYGESHFLHSFRGQSHSLVRPLHLVVPLVGILGGVAPVVGLVGLSALGLSRRVLLASGVAIALGYVLIVFIPDRNAEVLRSPVVQRTWISLNSLVFGALGLAVCGVAVLTAWRLVRGPREQSSTERDQDIAPARADYFVVLWLGLEVASYFALSPFPGVRRVLGLVVVGTLMVGRLAARTCQFGPRRALVNGLALGNIVLGLGLHAVELWDVRAERVAVRQVARLLRQKPPGMTVWFHVETWGGFAVYSQWAGLRRFQGYGEPQPCPGDWVAVMYRPALRPRQLASWGERIAQVEVHDFLPLRTVPSYWNGRTAVEHHEGPRALVDVYRLP